MADAKRSTRAPQPPDLDLFFRIAQTSCHRSDTTIRKLTYMNFITLVLTSSLIGSLVSAALSPFMTYRLSQKQKDRDLRIDLANRFINACSEFDNHLGVGNRAALASALLQQITILTTAIATKKNHAEFSLVVSHYVKLLKSSEAQGFVANNPQLVQATQQRNALSAILYAEAFGFRNRKGSILEELYKPALIDKAVEIAFERFAAQQANERSDAG